MSERRRRGKKAAVAAVAATAVGAGVEATLTPEIATASKGQCQGNRLCLWENGGFNTCYIGRGNPEDLYWKDNSWCNGNLNDRVSSVWNNRNGWTKLYQDYWGGGATLCLSPGAAVSDLETVPIDGAPWMDWSNRTSGHKFYGGGKPAGCDTVRSEQGCSM